MTTLNTHIACCEYTKALPIASASEKGKTYRLRNNSGQTISKWKIDNCIFKNETSCDFLFLINKENRNKQAFWVELKGADINQAVYQILETIKKLKLDSTDYTHHARIIPSKNPNPDLRSSDYKKLDKLIKANGGTIRNQNKLLEETI